jgi:hypothetical protein
VPLDSLQFEVLATLLPNRTPHSVVAGGSVLHRHAFRLSDDQDFFHPDGFDIHATADTDIALLKSAGFEVDTSARQDGLVEAIVYKPGYSPTKLQWVQSGLWNFFGAVPDDVFGWRLHMADISVNKVLAAASRHEARDFVDLAMIHRHVMPLWLAIWAAPGKDVGFNPVSLIERIGRNNHFSQAAMDEAVDALISLNAEEILQTVRSALDEAEQRVRELPMDLAGNLFVDTEGNVIIDFDRVLQQSKNGGLIAIGPVPDGAWPSGPEVDSLMVQRLIDHFGMDGSMVS